MLVKSFLRKNFPDIRQVCRRAALDECKDQYTDAILLFISLWCDLYTLVGMTDVSWKDVFSRWCAILRGPSIFSIIKMLSDFDEKIIHTRSRFDFYEEIETSFPSIPYRKYLVNYASRAKTSSSICQDRAFVPLLRSCLLFLKRIQGPQLDKDDLDAWLDINEHTRLNCHAMPPKAGWSKEITFPTAQLTSGSVSDVKHTYGKQGMKAKASCTLSKSAWKTLTKLDLAWPPSVMYPSRRIIGEPVSEILPVPKNWEKNRLISKEPAAQAWAQRRVAYVLRDAVKRWTKGCCNPTDDSRNRWLICLGGYSTIDLTSASDTVHRDWINTIPWMELRRAVWATRTPIARVHNDLVETFMAAGMGCGWTFSLECWVFSQIAKEYADDDYAVFGDDIVVPDNTYNDVCAALTRYGFKPNLSKSFGPGFAFRESCGLHVFHWEEVIDASPFYYPGRFTTTEVGRSPENFIDLQRMSAYHGWEGLQYSISRLLSGKLPFSDFWESELPWSENGDAAPNPTWGTYSLPSIKAARYSVSDVDRLPFALLQDYLGEECWDPTYPWIRKAVFSKPEKPAFRKRR